MAEHTGGAGDGQADRIRLGFSPRTGWRWWLHFGANETRLMYPRIKYPRIKDGPLWNLHLWIGRMAEDLDRALTPTLTSMVDAFAQIGAALGSQSDRINDK